MTKAPRGVTPAPPTPAPARRCPATQTPSTPPSPPPTPSRRGGQRHLRGLPLVRRTQRHTAVPIRVRPVLHQVRLLEAERFPVTRWGDQRQLPHPERGQRSRLGCPAGLRGPVKPTARRHP